MHQINKEKMFYFSINIYSKVIIVIYKLVIFYE